MSVTVSTCLEINMSPNNNSKSKQLYSFSKSPRFIPPTKLTSDKFYDLPPIKERRSAAIGYGHKYDFTQGGSKNPAPDCYNVRAEPTKDTTAWSFGLSREAVKVGQVNPHKPVPGPGTYKVDRSLSNIAYSFSSKGNRNDMAKSTSNIPGPGSYGIISAINPKGKYVLSSYKDSGASLFNPPKSKRFGELARNKGLPGPGAYDTTHGFDPKGDYFESKIKSSQCRTFSTGERNTLNLNKTSPGPGAYRLPSEFGHYEAKNAHQASASSPRPAETKEAKEDNKEAPAA